MTRYCPRCGVILADDLCPLCGAAAVDQKPASAESGGVAYPLTPRGAVSVDDAPALRTSEDPGVEGIDELSVVERGRVAVELLSVALGFALCVTLLIDLFAERRLGWSRYSSIGIVAAWLFAAMPVILRRKPWLQFAVLAPSLVLLVFCLDALGGRAGWFPGLGLPITLLGDGIAAGVIALVAAIRRKGLNVLAVFLSGIALFCVGLEGIIDLNATGKLALGWSVVVAFALVPISGLMFYLHYRIMNRASLRKLFRL
jgi:Family of unknown function (DUF6320)